jgi:molybdopterin guanine dinucleotide-containing S/N-oxide reductase-like protein
MLHRCPAKHCFLCIKDAAWAGAITGVPAWTIRALALQMAATRTMLTASWSLQRADHGERPYWALVLLAACLGQIGLPGGGLRLRLGGRTRRAAVVVSRAGHAGAAQSGAAGDTGRPHPDCLLHPCEHYDYDGNRATYPDIRLVYWAGGNPSHHHQDLNRLRRAWRRPETIIVHEPWWTAIARHADIVLPATTSLERNDLGGAPRDRFVIAMHKAIEPVGNASTWLQKFADDFPPVRAVQTAPLEAHRLFANLRNEVLGPTSTFFSICRGVSAARRASPRGGTRPFGCATSMAPSASARTATWCRTISR